MSRKAKIFLINVGANTSHSRQARSPIFPNRRWRYVPFPAGKSGQEKWGQKYPSACRRFIRIAGDARCHLDPDWDGLTYGDNCEKRRARALLSVGNNDVLLFWALLWTTNRSGTDIWETSKKGWYLIGTLRAQAFLKGGESTGRLPKSLKHRASKSAHVHEGRVETKSRKQVRVFVGHKRYSCRFSNPVDMEIGNDNGLLRRVFKAKDGRLLQWNKKPHWYSSLRPCRAILDVDEPAAKYLAQKIAKQSQGFNLLAGLH